MLEKEYEFYQTNKDEFVKKYIGKFIVIKNDAVIGVYTSPIEALRESVKTNEMGTFLIQEIKGNDEPVIRFYSRVYAQ